MNLAVPVATLALTTACALAAAPRTWPMYQYDPAHNAVFTDTQPPHRWRYDASAKINGGLAIAGNELIAESFAPAVFAIDRRDGKLLWRTALPDIAMTTPVIAQGLAIVGTGSNSVGIETPARLVWSRPQGDEVVALDARTGRVAWRYATAGEDMPSPALVNIGGRSVIVFANGDDHVRALDLRTGHLLWSTPLQGVATMSSAAASGGLVFVLAGLAAISHQPDRAYALQAAGGTIAWRAPYGNADVSPTVAGGRVFVEDAQTAPGGPQRSAFNDVEALDEHTGALLWSFQSGRGFFTSAGTNEEAIAGMVDRGALFQSLPAARRFAAFGESGRLLWSLPTSAAVKMSAVAANGRVYFGDTAGLLYAVDERTGRVAALRTFAQPFTCSSPVLIGGTLYVADGSQIFALNPP